MDQKLQPLKNRLTLSEDELVSIKNQYKAVFDQQFNIKNCGRNTCIKLINTLNKYGFIIGNKNTGFIDIDKAKSTYKDLVER